mmetsp:Transcript_49600/g.97018  ORF Transcript_49600/g.97018 Transcript_49600/m.97018 type:complete len:95 (-) Transcript_49600:174-458(-)
MAMPKQKFTSATGVAARRGSSRPAEFRLVLAHIFYPNFSLKSYFSIHNITGSSFLIIRNVILYYNLHQDSSHENNLRCIYMIRKEPYFFPEKAP